MLLNLNIPVCSFLNEAEIPALLELHHPSRFEEKLSSLLPSVGLPSLNQCLHTVRCFVCFSSSLKLSVPQIGLKHPLQQQQTSSWAPAVHRTMWAGTDTETSNYWFRICQSVRYCTACLRWTTLSKCKSEWLQMICQVLCCFCRISK